MNLLQLFLHYQRPPQTGIDRVASGIAGAVILSIVIWAIGKIKNRNNQNQ